MTDQITAADVTDILDTLNARQAQAHALVSDTYQSAIDICQERQAQIEEVSHVEFHAAELADLIEAAVLTPKPSRTALDVATGVFNQYLTTLIGHADVSPSESRSGGFVAMSALRYTAGLSPDQRRKVLTSIVLAAANKIDTGLVAFEGPEVRTLSESALQDWLAAIAPDQLEGWKSEKRGQSHDLLTVRAQLEHLEAAAPVLYRIAHDVEPTYTVRNVQRARSAVEGIVFEPETATVLTGAQYHALRQSRPFTAKVMAGHLVPESDHAAVEVLS